MSLDGTPQSLSGRRPRWGTNFADYLDRAATEAPTDVAVTDPDRELSYEAFAAETDAFANALVELDVESGDRVALYLPNSTAVERGVVRSV